MFQFLLFPTCTLPQACGCQSKACVLVKELKRRLHKGSVYILWHVLFSTDFSSVYLSWLFAFRTLPPLTCCLHVSLHDCLMLIMLLNFPFSLRTQSLWGTYILLNPVLCFWFCGWEHILFITNVFFLLFFSKNS